MLNESVSWQKHHHLSDRRFEDMLEDKEKYVGNTVGDKFAVLEKGVQISNEALVKIVSLIQD